MQYPRRERYAKEDEVERGGRGETILKLPISALLSRLHGYRHDVVEMDLTITSSLRP